MARSSESGKGENPTRREFLKASTAITGAAMAGTLGLNNRVYAAGSDILKVGMIGCGGRCRGAMPFSSPTFQVWKTGMENTYRRWMWPIGM